MKQSCLRTMFAKTHPSGAAGRKRSNSTSSAASSTLGGGNAPAGGIATAPGESSSEAADDRRTATGPQHKPSSTSTPVAQTGADARSNDTTGIKDQGMISGNKSHKSVASESHRQRQQHKYPTQKATNREPTMAPSTPKAPKHDGNASSSTSGRITGPNTDNRKRPAYSTPKRGGGNARIVHSPLIDAPPTPNPNAQDARLVTPRDRWKAMSELAGSHKQSLEVLDLSNRSLPAQALKFGVPRKTAQSIKDLRYDGNLVGDGEDGNNDLPVFIDIVVELFP